MITNTDKQKLKEKNIIITLNDILEVPEDLQDRCKEDDDNNETVDTPTAEDNEQYDIVSKVAYMLGIKEWVFESEAEPPKMEVYNELLNEKNARIIRNLCRIRNQMEHSFLRVCNAIREGRSIMSMSDILPTDAMQELSDEGINIYQNLTDATAFIIHLNKLIQERIGNCRGYFPEWICWDYLKDIFIMENGLTAEGTKQAAMKFYANMNNYPYRQYMNWPAKRSGNILKNDRRFLTLLYKWNNDTFTATNLVSDMSSLTKDNIYAFIDNSDKCVFIVDCENSDPYSFCAAIRSLGSENLKKINKIILFDDVNAASAWEMVPSYIDIPVEYVLIERLKENKSLADVKVVTRACKEFYANNVDSFVLVSSDSDYWGLIEDLPEARFLVMVEHDKCSSTLKGALLENNIFYCYLDNFYAGGGEDIRQDALHKEIAKNIKNTLDLDLKRVMEDVLKKTRIEMSEDEIKAFIKRRIAGQIDVEINDEGKAELVYRMRK